MPHYAYRARSPSGRPEEGILEASNADEAVAALQNRGLLVISIQEKRQPAMTVVGVPRRRRLHRGVKPQDLVVFARSLAVMIEAGLPLLRGLEAVGAQVRSQRLNAAISDIARDIRGGSTFRDALAKHPAIFSPFWISLVETGEASGQLTRSLEQIAIHLEKAGVIQRKVVSALIYPAILTVVAVAAVLVFTLKVIPSFDTLYSSLGAELPFLTRIVIALSNLMRGFFPLLVAGTLLAYFLVSTYVKTRPGRWQLDRLKLRLPVLGPIFQGASAEQFASNLGTLLRAGVPILYALEIAITTSDNKVTASVIEQMRAGAREGRPLAEPLTQTDFFPPMVAQMLAVGEQTGRLPDMLGEIAKYYEEQVSTAVQRMTSLLEPAMLILMGGVIGTLIVAMYLPIFHLSQAVKG